jgi:hypothetical protein
LQNAEIAGIAPESEFEFLTDDSNYPVSRPDEGVSLWQLVALSAALLGALIYHILEEPFWVFNSMRLLPSFLLVKGMPVFPAAHAGILQSTIYGPVTSLIFLPCTLSHSPVGAVLIGATLTVLLSMTGVLFLHIQQSPQRLRVALLTSLATGFLICQLEPLRYSCLLIHSDGPGMLFGMLAIGMTKAEGRGRLAMSVAACLSGLAVWTKQPLIGIPVGIGIFYLLSAGRSAFIRFSLYACGASVVLTVLSSAAFGWRNLLVNLLLIPGHQPWKNPSKTLELLNSLRLLVKLDFAMLLPLLAYVLFRFAQRPSLHEIEGQIRGKLWPCALLVGLCLVPFSLMGESKTGGDINSLSFCTLFLLMALMLLLQQLATSNQLEASRFARALIISAAVLGATFSAPLVVGIPSKIKTLPKSEQNLAYIYMKKHPGLGYFPWSPVAQLLADGQVYNGVYGLWDHISGGFPPTKAEFLAHVPANAAFVAFEWDGSPLVNGVNFMSYLPDYTCATKDPELPGFNLFYTQQAAQSLNISCSPQNPYPASLRDRSTDVGQLSGAE